MLEDGVKLTPICCPWKSTCRGDRGRSWEAAAWQRLHIWLWVSGDPRSLGGITGEPQHHAEGYLLILFLIIEVMEKFEKEKKEYIAKTKREVQKRGERRLIKIIFNYSRCLIVLIRTIVQEFGARKSTCPPLPLWFYPQKSLAILFNRSHYLWEVFGTGGALNSTSTC